MIGVAGPQVQPEATTLHSWFKGPANSTRVQLFRYLIVGGVAFLLDFGLLYVLTEWARVHYLTSAAIGFCAGLLLNYALSRAWVFPNRRLQQRALEFGVFAIIGLIGLGLNEAGIWFLTGKIGMDYRISKLVNTGFVLAWNFLARKYSLFS